MILYTRVSIVSLLLMAVTIKKTITCKSILVDADSTLVGAEFTRYYFFYLNSPYVLNMDLNCFLFEAPGLELLKNTTSNP